MIRSWCLALFIFLAGVSQACAAQTRFAVTDPIGQNFGVQLKPWHTTDADLTQIKALGFGLVRWPIAWDSIEKAPGVYDWSEPDAFFKRLKAAGLRSVIILGRGNPIYSGMVDTAPNLMSKDTASPAAPSDIQEYAVFAAFAAAAAKRYSEYSPIWEIWNEPDLDHFWPPNANPAQYAGLAGAACEAIRRADPNSTVIGPGAAAMPSAGAAIYQTVLGGPAGKCFSALSGHAYRIRKGQAIKTPETVQADNLAARQWLGSHGGGAMTYVCSEWGYAEPLVRAQDQAAYPLRAHLSNLLSGVPLTVWYEWRNSKREPANPESHYGLVDYDGRQKAGAADLAAVLPKIAGATLVRRVALGNDGRYAVLVRQPAGEYGLVYWTTDAAGSAAHPLQVGSARVNMTALPAYLRLGDQVPLMTLR